MRRPLLLTLALFLATGLGCHRAAPLPVIGNVPDFTLISSTGQPFLSRDALKGHLWVADFIFTNCPGPCPRITSRMHELQEAVHEPADLRFVSFTIDPARDNPAALARYARSFHADPARWYFLTGPMAAINQLTRYAFLLFTVDGSLEHSTRLVLVDRQSRIRGYYESNDPESLKQLRADIANLAKENS